MSSRPLYAIAGLILGAAVDLLINLLAAALQQQAFADQFSRQSIGWLVGFIVGGLLVGYWLSGPSRVSPPASSQPALAGSAQTVTLTRLRALLSYVKLRGKGISLGDVLSIGSRIDIDTRD
jgi:hypothetical protein